MSTRLFALLRFCINARLMYLARNLPPTTLSAQLKRFDSMVDAALCRIAMIQQLPIQGAILRGLPVNLMGLGLPRLEEINTVAYYSSLLQAIQFYQEVDHNFLNLINRTHDADPANWIISGEDRSRILDLLPAYIPEEGVGLRIANPIIVPLNANENALALSNAHKQSAVMTAIYKTCYTKLLTVCKDARDSISYAYFVALPRTASLVPLLSGITTIHPYQLTPNEFRELLQRILRVPVFLTMDSDSARCMCGTMFTNLKNDQEVIACRAAIALTGHVGICSEVSSASRDNRHKAVVAALAKFLKAVEPNNEVDIEKRILGTDIRADIIATNRLNQTHKYIDVTLCSAVRQAVTSVPNITVDTATELSERDKKSRISAIGENAAENRRILTDFLPFAITDTGRVGKEAMAYVDSVTKWDAVPRIPDARLAAARRHFIRTLGVIVNKYNYLLRVALRKTITWVEVPT